MTRVALLCPSLDPGDAVSADVRGMARVLTDAGYQTEIFAESWNIPEPVRPADTTPDFLKEETDVLIYHYAFSWKKGRELFESLHCRKIIKYHNVTPPEFYAPYSARLAERCEESLRMLSELIHSGADIFAGDSSFNVQDLIDRGAPADRCRVFAPLHDIPGLLETETDAATQAEFAHDKNDGRILLMTGRLVPNKGYAALLRAFALYRKSYDPEARLILAGRANPELGLYYRELSILLDELEIRDGAVFAGAVSAEELKALYLAADAYVCLSEHEGFCVPLLEAMAFYLPFIALARGAMPETAGDGGLIFDEPDPALFAAALGLLRDKPEISKQLARAGRLRYETRFTNEIIGDSLLAVMKEVAPALRP